MGKVINPKSTFFEFLTAAVDPMLLIEPRVQRRVEQYSTKLWHITIYFNLVVWTFIWALTIFLNDWEKPNFYAWLQYRLTVILVFSILALVFHFFKKSALVSYLVILLLAGTQSVAFSWAFSLSNKMSKEYIVLFSALVLATCIRSYLLNIILLASILFTSRIFWHPFVSGAVVFTHYEIAVYVFTFTSVAHAAILKNKENSLLLEEVQKQKAEQETEFYNQLLTFVSPTIVKTLQTNRRPDQPLSESLNQLLNRQRTKLSVLYCDWRGFSKKSDNLDFIENELIPSTATIIDNSEGNGGVSKQTGDAILTFFPSVDHEESLLLAVKSGIEAFIYEKNRRTTHQADRYFVITSGQALTGNMASMQHREFTIMGKPANKSVRIDELTKEEPLTTLINERDYIIIDYDSSEMLQTFSKTFSLKKVVLSELELAIRTYEDEPYVSLFEVCEQNIQIVNQLLKIKGHEPIKSRFEK